MHHTTTVFTPAGKRVRVLDLLCPATRNEVSISRRTAWGRCGFAGTGADINADIGAGLERKIAARLAHRGQIAEAEALRRGWREREARPAVSPREGTGTP